MPKQDENNLLEGGIADETAQEEIEKYKPTTIEVLKAMDRGMTAKEATLLVKGKANLCEAAEYKIKEKYRKWSLASPAMQKAAHLAVRETLTMKPLEERTTSIIDDKEVTTIKRIYPSHTNRLAAAAMVADRVEPIVRQNLNLNLNADIKDLIPAEVSGYE